MPCDTRFRDIYDEELRQTRRQTITERKTEVRKAVDKLSAALVAGRVKAKIGPQGAIAFEGFKSDERDGVTDACAYRRLLVSGSPLALAKIAQAEQLAGRQVNKQIVGHGAHSHDGGVTWHNHKG